MGREGAILFLSSTSTRSPTFRHLLAIFHLRRLPDILITSRVITWLLLDEIYPALWINSCLNVNCDSLANFMLDIVLQWYITDSQWIWTHMDYHPSITSEPNVNLTENYFRLTIKLLLHLDINSYQPVRPSLKDKETLPTRFWKRSTIDDLQQII